MNNLILWRYFSQEKWEFLLKDRGLYFSKASNFKDKREGYYEPLKFSDSFKKSNPDSAEAMIKAERMLENMRDSAPDHTYISCWQNVENESLQMWKEYVPSCSEGVLIRTDILSLLWNIPDSLSELISSAHCKYYNQEKDNLNSSYPFEFKEDKYFFEYEFRLILNSREMNVRTGFNPDGLGEVSVFDNKMGWMPFHETLPKKDVASNLQVKNGKGYVVRFPLNKLFHEVRVHPMASDQYLSKVHSELIGLGVNCPVNRSVISAEEYIRNK